MCLNMAISPFYLAEDLGMVGNAEIGASERQARKAKLGKQVMRHATIPVT